MKLLIGGSPCKHWSIAKTRGRETEPSGIGWELFDNYLIARDKFKPEYFLYENNYSMSAAIREQITEELGVEPILINSARVSAQSRQRLYWTNIPGVKQPEDRGIVLRDVLESGVPMQEKSYTLKANYAHAGAVNGVCGQHFPAPMAAEPVNMTADGKAVTLTARPNGSGVDSPLYAVRTPIEYNPLQSCDVVVTDQNIRCTYKDGSGTAKGYTVYFDDVKGPSVIAGHAHKMKIIEPATGKEWPVYEVRDGRITIKGEQYPNKLADGFYIIRKLTVLECKRLQTVPDSYIFPVSDTQAYRQLGNGWTVDVIAHILSYCLGITEKPLEVLSMYDGMSCGRLALDKLGAWVAAYWATEIDKYAIKTTQANFPDTVQLGDAFQVREDGWKPWEGAKQ